MTIIKGIIKQGHQVASGQATNSPYPRGTIEMQTPFFQQLGLDLTPFFPGTLNISLSPLTFLVKKPEYTFKNVKWNPAYPAEDFSFSPCQVLFENQSYPSLIYYPHPESKIGHFQDKSTIEVLAPFIENITYGMNIELIVNPKVIIIE